MDKSYVNEGTARKLNTGQHTNFCCSMPYWQDSNTTRNYAISTFSDVSKQIRRQSSETWKTI